MIKIKRAYEDYSKFDGYRILVDRLWPRGISKEHLKIDLWIKELTPSNDLRKWYHNNLEKKDQFRKKYLIELEKHNDLLNDLKKMIDDRKTVTLLSASKDAKPVHAIILKQKLEE